MSPEPLQQVLKAIETGNQHDLIIGGLLICVVALASYFGARLKKAGELQEIKDNFDDILEQQRQLAAETGKIKASLDQGNLRYQIQLSSYQENSVRAIEAIYIGCLSLRDATLAVAHSRENRELLFEKSRELVTIYDQKRIWLPTELSERIREIADQLDQRSRRFMRAQDAIDNVATIPQQAIDRAITEQDAFYDFLQLEIHKLFEGHDVPPPSVAGPFGVRGYCS